MDGSEIRALGRPPTVGVFDSGVGGLSVWQEVARLLPDADLLYLADQAHCPYGGRSAEEIREYASAITCFLVERGADAVVVACNTASAAALTSLRQQFSVPVVGMEPAVKPAASYTQTGHIGVIATQVTFQGQLFASLIERFASGVTVHCQVCPGLVERVETGELEERRTILLLDEYLGPMLEAGVDTIVLGCTHYAFLMPAIERVAGPGVRVVDPAPAVARQTVRVLSAARTLASGGPGSRILYTTGPQGPFAAMVERLGISRTSLTSPLRFRSVRWPLAQHARPRACR